MFVCCFSFTTAVNRNDMCFSLFLFFFVCNFVAFRTPVHFSLLSRLKKKKRERKKSLEAFVSVDSPIAACTGVVIHRVLLPPIGIAQRHLRFVW